MKKERKTKYLHIRIRESEKEEIKSVVKFYGFDTITTYMLWLHRTYKHQWNVGVK